MPLQCFGSRAMKLARMSAGRNTALAGLVWAVAMLATGCMSTTASRHVDTISRWHKGHADALRAFLSAQSQAHMTAADTRIQLSLVTAKHEVANKLRQVAWEKLKACGTNSRNDPCVSSAKQCVDEYEERLRHADADRMNRVGDAVEWYRLIQQLGAAREVYWEAVSRSRDECATKVSDGLRVALKDLDGEFDAAIVKATDRVRRALQQRWEYCQGGVRLRLDDAAWAIDELEKCKVPAPGDCRPWQGPRWVGLGKPRLYRCLDILTDEQELLNAISGGQQRLHKATPRFQKALELHLGKNENKLADGNGSAGACPASNAEAERIPSACAQDQAGSLGTGGD